MNLLHLLRNHFPNVLPSKTLGISETFTFSCPHVSPWVPISCIGDKMWCSKKKSSKWGTKAYHSQQDAARSFGGSCCQDCEQQFVTNASSRASLLNSSVTEPRDPPFLSIAFSNLSVHCPGTILKPEKFCSRNSYRQKQSGSHFSVFLSKEWVFNNMTFPHSAIVFIDRRIHTTWVRSSNDQHFNSDPLLWVRWGMDSAYGRSFLSTDLLKILIKYQSRAKRVASQNF